MSIPKRQHTVPQMLLARFTDRHGWLYFFDKRIREKGVLKSKPNNVFVQKHIYSLVLPDGTKDPILERYYAQIEGVANTLIEKIVVAARSESLPRLTVREKRQWDNFIHHQWKRSPDFTTKIWSEVDFEASLRHYIDEFERDYRPLTNEERETLAADKTKARLKQNARVQALLNPGTLVSNVLASRGIGVAHIKKTNKSFITGSFSMVKLTHSGTPELTHPSTELWLPVSHDVAVTPAGEPGSEHFSEILDERHIRAINKAITFQSTTIAGRSSALIRSLGKPR